MTWQVTSVRVWGENIAPDHRRSDDTHLKELLANDWEPFGVTKHGWLDAVNLWLRKAG